MTSFSEGLHASAAALNDLGARYALVGGLAVSVRTEPRFTRDIDFAVAVSDDAHAEAIVHQLTQRGYAIRASVEHETRRRLATVRLSSSEGGLVDLLFASSGVEQEIVAAAEIVEVVPTLSIAVARTGHLVAQKLLSHDACRPQDLVDLQSLLDSIGDDELVRASEACSLITSRGYARGKDLLALLEELRRPKSS